MEVARCFYCRVYAIPILSITREAEVTSILGQSFFQGEVEEEEGRAGL